MRLNDQSAWYHVVYSVDTTQGTDTNRVKIYVNGTQVTSFQPQLILVKILIGIFFKMVQQLQ
jgi:hypothetical protein